MNLLFVFFVLNIWVEMLFFMFLFFFSLENNLLVFGSVWEEFFVGFIRLFIVGKMLVCFSGEFEEEGNGVEFVDFCFVLVVLVFLFILVLLRNLVVEFEFLINWIFVFCFVLLGVLWMIGWISKVSLIKSIVWIMSDKS